MGGLESMTDHLERLSQAENRLVVGVGNRFSFPTSGVSVLVVPLVETASQGLRCWLSEKSKDKDW